MEKRSCGVCGHIGRMNKCSKCGATPEQWTCECGTQIAGGELCPKCSKFRWEIRRGLVEHVEQDGKQPASPATSANAKSTPESIGDRGKRQNGPVRTGGSGRLLGHILRIVVSVLLALPCAMLAALVTSSESWAEGAIFLGVYASSLIVVWNTAKRWPRRFGAFVIGALVAFAIGSIAETMPPLLIYGSVAVAFSGVVWSVIATLLVLGTLRSAKSVGESSIGAAILWVIFWIFFASSFATPPYDAFPALLAGAVLAMTVMMLLYSVGFARSGTALYKSIDAESVRTKAILFVIVAALFFWCSHIISHAIVEVAIRSLPM